MNSCNLVGTVEGEVQLCGSEDKPTALFGMSLRCGSKVTKSLIKITCNSSAAEFVAKHCQPGDLVSVIGLLWIDDYGGISVRATRIDALKLEPSFFSKLHKKEARSLHRKQSAVFDRP